MKKVCVMLLAGLLSLACGICELSTQPLPEPDGEYHCGPLPQSFQESDLVGVWKELAGDEVIILQEDQTYKQVVPYYDYESPWNQWWIEHRPSGGIYIHLEKMRYTGGGKSDFERPEGGSDYLPLWDPCEYRRLKMQGEVILAVARDNLYAPPDTAPHGVILIYMRDTDGIGGAVFVRQK